MTTFHEHANQTLGAGLVQDLLTEFGKRAGQAVLNWLLKRLQSDPAPAHLTLPGGGIFRHYAAQLLRDHREEVLDAARNELGVGYDELVKALDA